MMVPVTVLYRDIVNIQSQIKYTSWVTFYETILKGI